LSGSQRAAFTAMIEDPSESADRRCVDGADIRET
jgi:hypothetical protein